MSSRLLFNSGRMFASTSTAVRAVRSFQSSSARLDAVAAAAPTLAARKPMGAFRGGLFGFLLGTTLAGSGVYYYVVQEYKAANERLMEDIYVLQAATERLSKHLTTLEDKLEVIERKSK